MDALKCVKAILAGESDKVLKALKGGLDPNTPLGTAMAWDWPKEEWGPTLLHLAALSATATVLVPAMLAAGGDPQAKWVYRSKWDADDCYMYTSEVQVAKAIEAHASATKDYFKAFYDDDQPSWSGNVKLRKLGFFNEAGDPLYGAPSDEVAALMKDASLND
jgi:hypothetical protein